MRIVRGKLDPRADCIDVVAGDLQIYWANNLLSVWREDCRDIGVCIDAEDKKELHISACGCDVVLDSYSNTDGVRRIRARTRTPEYRAMRPVRVPVCPDCHALMVKTRVQDEEGNWARHWLCECKVGPPEEGASDDR